MSYNINPRYANLLNIFPELKLWNFEKVEVALKNKFQPTLHHYWCRDGSTSLNRAIEDFGHHVIIYKVDYVAQIIWMHVAMLPLMNSVFFLVRSSGRLTRSLQLYALTTAKYKTGCEQEATRLDEIAKRLLTASDARALNVCVEIMQFEAVFWRRMVDAKC